MIRFDNSYARMPQGFFARVDPTPVTAPSLLALNGPLADRLGLDRDALTVEIFIRAMLIPQGAPLPRRLCRAPVRRLRAAVGRRARRPSGRDRGPRRGAF